MLAHQRRLLADKSGRGYGTKTISYMGQNVISTYVKNAHAGIVALCSLVEGH